MSGTLNRDALIRDLAAVLSGVLHPASRVGPGPRLAANRVRDVLGIDDGERNASVEAKIREALAPGALPPARAAELGAVSLDAIIGALRFAAGRAPENHARAYRKALADLDDVIRTVKEQGQ